AVAADVPVALVRVRRAALAVVPAELGLAAHARTLGDAESGGFHVAGQRAGDGDAFGAHAAVDLGAVLDGEVAAHVDVALEAARDAHVTGALDQIGRASCR